MREEKEDLGGKMESFQLTKKKFKVEKSPTSTYTWQKANVKSRGKDGPVGTFLSENKKNQILKLGMKGAHDAYT